MKKILHTLPILLLAACKPSSSLSLPKERPADLRITYYNGGGMLPESEDAEIRADSTVWHTFFNSHQGRWACKTDPKALDGLYAELVKEDAGSITARSEGEVYDRGGTTLTIEYGGKRAEIADAGNSFVVEGDQERWRQTVNAVLAYVHGCLANNRVPATIEVTVADSVPVIEEFNMSLNRESVMHWEQQNAEPLRQMRRVDELPGSYELSCNAKIQGKYIQGNAPVIIDGTHNAFKVTIHPDRIEVTQ